MAAWTMPMYTAASPGNLLPKFSAPADGGTIARRASLLQSRTGAADKDAPVGVLPTREVVVAGAAAAYAAAPTRTTRTAKANLDFIVAPFPTRSPRRREAARRGFEREEADLVLGNVNGSLEADARPLPRHLLGDRARPSLARLALTCGAACEERLDEVARHPTDRRRPCSA